MQAVRQEAAPSHISAPQELTATGTSTQVPAPSHKSATWLELPAGQVTALQRVVAGQSWQPPAPSQCPSRPQVLGSCWVQVPVGSAPPAGTAVQVPSKPDTPQLMHDPQVATPQQKPFVQ